MDRCFECKHVNTNVEYECSSGVGDLFCYNCAARNDFICPLCGSDLVAIKKDDVTTTTTAPINKVICKFCGKAMKRDWKYCPHCLEKI